MNQPNRFAPKPRTIADIEGDLFNFLVSSTDAAFNATTLEDLLRRYSKLNPRVVEAKWNAAVQRRKGGW